MMPNVAGQASTRRQIFAYALVLAPVGVLPWELGCTTPVYGVAAVLLGAGFVWYAWKVLAMADGDRVMVPQIEGAEMDVGDDVEVSRDHQGNYEAETGYGYGR